MSSAADRGLLKGAAQMVARYDAAGGWYQDWVGDLVDDPPMEAMLALAGQCAGARVLDVGCGEGRGARALAGRGASVTGIDVSADLIDRARSAETTNPLGITYLLADAATPSWWDGTTFDGVVSNMVLSDLGDLPASLATVAAVLTPGGWFAFTMLHPCFPGSTGRLPSWSSNGYFDERWWTTGGDGVRGRVGAHHRTLSTYLNALTLARLAIETAAEPGPPAAEVPTWLALKCRRTTAT